MARATINSGGDNRKATYVMPSFISQTPVSNTISKEANAAQTPTRPDFGVLEQYLGFHVGDGGNASYAAATFDPSLRNQTSSDLQSGAFDKSGASINMNFSKDFWSQMQPNLASVSGAHGENWREPNMVGSSSHTATSTDVDPEDKNHKFEIGQSMAVVASDSSDRSKEKTPDQKTLRRLAQNREAARKSRLRKKAYVQQLENSRLKLTQLEQEQQKARRHGTLVSGIGDQSNAGTGNGALAFDMEYGRWSEEQSRRISELRAAVNSHVGDTELVSIVENVTGHFNEIFKLKGNASKADVFHILSGMWKTPAERCFMWIGGFRPSELLKLLASQLEPLTQQQLTGIYNLQQSSNQAEDALSQGMDALQQSLSETLVSGSSAAEGSSGNVANYMGQMAMAMGKLGTLEGFLQQADNLRQQTLQQMHRTLTTRQSARALLLIHDYFSRLRALSSLWLARPKE